MTVLLAIVLYVLALLVVLALAGGVGRADKLHGRATRDARGQRADPDDAQAAAPLPPTRAPTPPRRARTPVDDPGRRFIGT